MRLGFGLLGMELAHAALTIVKHATASAVEYQLDCKMAT